MKPQPKAHEDHHAHHHDGHHHHFDIDKHSERAMAWYGWGSPVGLGFFIMSLGVFMVLLEYAGFIGS